MIGSTLSHYTIEAVLGQGGMGTVYRARDTWLGRTVAIKVLSSSSTEDHDRAARMLREAKAASSLNHPNIITIHEFDRSGDIDLIVMEHVDGQALSARIAEGSQAIKQVVDYASQIASALAAAHEAGIVHRDVKPGNVMVGRDGRIKVLDFGLARHSVEVRSESPTATLDSRVTGRGVVVGSIGYMAPEQIEGKPADARSDVFSLGVVMFEMLTGRRPFTGDSDMAVLAANLKADVPAIDDLRADTPRDLRRVVARCLARKSEERYPSAKQLAEDLDAVRRRLAAPPRPLPVKVAAVVLVAAVAALAGSVAWFWVRESRLRWVRNVAIPEIRRLDAQGDNFAAFLLFRRAREIAPDDAQLVGAWSNTYGGAEAGSDFDTDPQGAELFVAAYGSNRDDWVVLGTTPLKHVLAPDGAQWRARKPGYDTIEAAVAPNHLVRSGSGPRGMVLVPAGQMDVGHGTVDVPTFWIDTYEVTNRQFKEFISSGGYARRELWNEPFVKDGHSVSWTEAIAEFHDGTGRPGPSTWNLGTYPEGQADSPVSGVSWYEAMAYATYARKALPTVYQWYQSSDAFGWIDNIVRASNFSGQGPARVGQYRGLTSAGTYDMAGNVKEWCLNGTRAGERYIPGGAWYDAFYQFRSPDTRSAFERRPGFGFRCAKQDAPVKDIQIRAIDISFSTTTERLAAKPVADDVFRLYLRQFDYDRTPLHQTTDSIDDANSAWRRHRSSGRAAAV